ncbi:MAG: late competence development ComFB family protein [Candidatus Omnitrophica bacterium]|nr:late competence development ComFB family protein [Candidatus Omnitrophota bacterium]
MKAHNIMEDIVEKYLKEMILADKTVCKCESCYDKMIAEVLSNIPAKYVTSETGAIYAVIEQVRVEQSSVILKELVKIMKNLKPHSKT